MRAYVPFLEVLCEPLIQPRWAAGRDGPDCRVGVFMIQEPPKTGRLLFDASDGDAYFPVVDAAAPPRGVGDLLVLLPGIQDDLYFPVGIKRQGLAHHAVGIFQDPEYDPAR